MNNEYADHLEKDVEKNLNENFDDDDFLFDESTNSFIMLTK